jgi:hypothetical protein
MKRLSMLAAAVLLLVLAAMPASAQYGGGGGGGGNPPVDEPTSPPPTEGQVQVTTPCNTIIVTGRNFGPGTTVFIERNFDSDECPGQGNPPNVLIDTEDGDATDDDDADDGAFAAQSGGPRSATAGEDGTVSVPVQVPADATGEFVVTLRGTDLDGQAKEHQLRYQVQPASTFTPAAAAEGTTSTTALAVAALLLAVVLGVGFNWTALTRRFSR